MQNKHFFLNFLNAVDAFVLTYLYVMRLIAAIIDLFWMQPDSGLNAFLHLWCESITFPYSQRKLSVHPAHSSAIKSTTQHPVPPRCWQRCHSQWIGEEVESLSGFKVVKPTSLTIITGAECVRAANSRVALPCLTQSGVMLPFSVCIVLLCFNYCYFCVLRQSLTLLCLQYAMVLLLHCSVHNDKAK